MSTLVTTNLKHGGAASPNLVLNSDGDVTFGGNVTLGSSVLATPTGSAPSYTCRAWVNFNGIGTVAIRAGGNVSSITDVGTGLYTVNFTTAMPDANYALTFTVGGGVGSRSAFSCLDSDSGPHTTTSAQLIVRNSSNSNMDAAHCMVAVFH